MKKNYSNPNTEISWWIGDNLCDRLGSRYAAPENGERGNPTSKVNTSSPS